MHLQPSVQDLCVCVRVHVHTHVSAPTDSSSKHRYLWTQRVYQDQSKEPQISALGHLYLLLGIGLLLKGLSVLWASRGLFVLLGSQVNTIMTGFLCGFWGSDLRSSDLKGERLTNEATSSSPPFLIQASLYPNPVPQEALPDSAIMKKHNLLSFHTPLWTGIPSPSNGEIRIHIKQGVLFKGK